MTTATLDTHRIVKRLQDAGASEPLAETMTDVLRETRELDIAQLVTKADLATGLRDLEQRMTIKLGSMIVGVAFVQVLTLVGSVLAILRFFPGVTP